MQITNNGLGFPWVPVITAVGAGLYAAGGTVAAKTQPPVIISPPKPPKEGIPEWVWIAGIGLVGAYFILRK